jgi:hypothetical protein
MLSGEYDAFNPEERIMPEELKPEQVMGAKGGKAAAAKMTVKERKERAKKAAAGRWHKNLPRVTHGSDDRPMRIGSIAIPCYVLDNGMRVITHRGLQGAISMAVTGSASETAAFVAKLGQKGLDCSEIVARISNPTEFVPGFGRTAFGYEATLLADLCDLFLEARSRGGILSKAGERMAAQCEILARGFARVGIIALVDEATGYQYNRLQDELQQILERYVSKEVARYSRLIEPEFYQHICRLRGWKYDPKSSKRTHAFARLTVDLIYNRIHPNLCEGLKEARQSGGTQSQHLHRWLTNDPEGGRPRTRQQSEGVISLLFAAKTWGEFVELVDRRYPLVNSTQRIPFPECPDSEGDEDSTTLTPN